MSGSASYMRTGQVARKRFPSAAGLDANYITSREARYRNISVENIFKLADALGVEPGDLFRQGEAD